MSDAEELVWLLAQTRDLPSPTDEEVALQKLDWVYGNLACSTNHKPAREVIKQLAMGLGLSEEVFEAWAEGKTWTR